MSTLKETLKWAHIDGASNPDFDRFQFASRRSVVWSCQSKIAWTSASHG